MAKDLMILTFMEIKSVEFCKEFYFWNILIPNQNLNKSKLIVNLSVC